MLSANAVMLRDSSRSSHLLPVTLPSSGVSSPSCGTSAQGASASFPCKVTFKSIRSRFNRFQAAAQSQTVPGLPSTTPDLAPAFQALWCFPKLSYLVLCLHPWGPLSSAEHLAWLCEPIPPPFSESWSLLHHRL